MLNINEIQSDSLKEEYLSIYNKTVISATAYATLKWKEPTYQDAYIAAELANIDKQFEYKLEQLK